MAHQHEGESVYYPYYFAIIRHKDDDNINGFNDAYFTFTESLPVCPRCLCEQFAQILRYHLVHRFIDRLVEQPKIPTEEQGIKSTNEFHNFLGTLSLADLLTNAYGEGKLTIFGQNKEYFVQPICSVDFPQTPKAIYGDDFESFFANIFRDTYPHIEVTDAVLKQAIQEISKTHKDEPVERVMDLIEQYILSNNLQEDIQE